jgi:hypothetical protein
MTAIQWTLHPSVAEAEHAKEWAAIQRKLLRAPKMVHLQFLKLLEAVRGLVVGRLIVRAGILPEHLELFSP